MASAREAGPGVVVTLPVVRSQLTGIQLFVSAAVVAHVEVADFFTLNDSFEKALPCRGSFGLCAQQIDYHARLEAATEIGDRGGPLTGEHGAHLRGIFR